jgi:hypothetical protein
MDLGIASDVLIQHDIIPDRVFGNWGRHVWNICCQAAYDADWRPIPSEEEIKGMIHWHEFPPMNEQQRMCLTKALRQWLLERGR